MPQFLRPKIPVRGSEVDCRNVLQMIAGVFRDAETRKRKLYKGLSIVGHSENIWLHVQMQVFFHRN